MDRRILWTITLLSPVVFVLLLEVLLRLFHAGPDLSLFIRENVGNRTYLIMNPDVKRKYFARVEFSPATSMDYMAVRKPPGVFRIFCLGGSTTVGFPYGYAGAFPAFLEERLRRLFPDRSFEVVNLGMTATNSFTTLDIASEALNYDPDLLIVYDGHNEFYGALGVASRESIGGSRWIVKFYLSLLRTRIFYFLREIYLTAAPMHGTDQETSQGTMMERLARGRTVEYGSPAYREALESFSGNLADLAIRAHDHRVPLLVGTQVSNLSDFPPFVHSTGERLDDSRRSMFDTLLARASALATTGDRGQAIRILDSALAVDSTRADAHFLRGFCLREPGEAENACRSFQRARDFDMLRFRTSSDFNRAILAVSRFPGAGAIDLETPLRAASPDSQIGRALILEHLHPNARGAFLIAREFVKGMRSLGVLAPEDSWEKRDTVTDETFWNERSLTDFDELAAGERLASLTARWPFTPGERLPTPRVDDPAIASLIRKMIRGDLTWEQAHVAAAEAYRKNGMGEKEEREYRSIIARLGVNVSPYYRLAQAYITDGHPDDAIPLLQHAHSLEPSYDALRTIGSIRALQRRYSEAMEYYVQAAPLAAHAQERNEIQQLLTVTREHLEEQAGDEQKR